MMTGKMMTRGSIGTWMLVLVVLGTSSLALGRTIYESFDEYADQAAFEAVWTVDYSVGGILSDVNPLGPGNCVLTNTSTPVASNTRDFGDLEPGIASTTIYDSLTDEPLQILVMSNGATYQFASIEIDPNNDSGYYRTRLYNFSGDTSATISTTFARSLGEHVFEMRWDDTGVVEFYIDDTLVRTSSETGNTSGFDAISIGKAILSGPGAVASNAVGSVSITEVPEPATMSLLFAGAAVLGLIKKRR